MPKKIEPKALTGISNVQFWNECRKNNPQFESYTSEGTKDTFTEQGFEALKSSDLNVLNKFFELSLRVAFQKIDIARAVNPLSDIGLVEVYNTPNGGFVQRIAVDSISPISPVYNNLENGSSVDPYKVRKPKSSQRFFTQNYDYQNLVTIQEYQAKQIFLDEYGMGSYIAGVLEGLETGRTKQEYVNIKEVLNAGINSTEYPLKDTQKIATSLPEDISTVTDNQLREFIESVMDLMTGMSVQVSSGQYNAAGFDTKVDNADYVLLVRAGIRNKIKTRLMVGAYNPEDLAIPIDRVVEVSDFGGLYPYAEDSYTTRVYPVYDAFGSDSGYFIKDADAGNLEKKTNGDVTLGYQAGIGANISTIPNVIKRENVWWKDENAEVMAIVAQRGLIFENRQNPYTINPIYNPAGLYTNYWASSPRNGINYDYYYNVVLFLSQNQV